MSMPSMPAFSGDFYYGSMEASAPLPVVQNAFPVFTYEDNGSMVNDTELDFSILSEYILNDDLPFLEPVGLESTTTASDGTHSSKATSASQAISDPGYPFDMDEDFDEDEFNAEDDGEKGRKRKKNDKSKEQVDRRR